MAFPNSNEPIPPQKHDGVDAVTTSDMQWVEDTLTGIQSVIGTNPADRTDIGGQALGTLAANFQSLCRLEIGNLPSSGWGTTLTVDGHVYETPDEEDYFKYYRHYFAAGRFTKPPLVFFPQADPLSGTYYHIRNYAWRVTKDYFQCLKGADVSGYYGAYVAIQPPFSD